MRFQRVVGRNWQFKGVVQDAVAAMLVIGEERVLGWIEQEAQKAGIMTGEGQGEWEVCQEWLRQKTVVSRVEMSGLFRVFWEFSGAGGVGKRQGV